MAVFIVRISEKRDGTTLRETLLPDYGDGYLAMEALKKLLQTYKRHSLTNTECWAEDDEGRGFRFQIT